MRAILLFRHGSVPIDDLINLLLSPCAGLPGDEGVHGAHCNYFGPMTAMGQEVCRQISGFLRDLSLFFKDTYVFCDIKQANRAFIYKMQSLIFKLKWICCAFFSL